MLPAKQGLKLKIKSLGALFFNGWRDASSKTRIETLIRRRFERGIDELERCFQQNKD
jgi:hypothetical protein